MPNGRAETRRVDRGPCKLLCKKPLVTRVKWETCGNYEAEPGHERRVHAAMMLRWKGSYMLQRKMSMDLSVPRRLAISGMRVQRVADDESNGCSSSTRRRRLEPLR